MLIDLDYLLSKYNLNIKGIIHIGAHELEEKIFYNKLNCQVIWIEGNINIVNKYRHSGDIIYCAVISDKDEEEKEFIITNGYQSSSILELKTHKQEHPEIHEIYRYKVKTKRLDTLMQEQNVDLTNLNFLNIDIQGAELLALKGAGKVLDHMDYLYLEVNEKELYEGCALLPELDDFLEKANFTRVETSMTKHGWGDALYIRKTLII